jgi:hypothetical protein
MVTCQGRVASRPWTTWRGWISLTLASDADDDRWQQVEEWVRTSFILVAPKTLARLVT